MPPGVYKHKKGWKHSEETKRKIGKANSLALKGRKLSKEHCKKISEYNKRIGRIPPSPLGREFSLETRKKISEKLKGRPRRNDHVKGERNWNWKGGVTPERTRIWQSKEYQEWRKAVFERDNYTCVICKIKCKKGNKVMLNADHIKPFAYFPELRFEIDNGRTLCISCHRKTDTYGSRYKKFINTNLSQFTYGRKN